MIMSRTLIALRQSRFLSQVEAAHRAGISQATVSRLERGTCLNVSCLARLLSALGASPTIRDAVFVEIGTATSGLSHPIPGQNDSAILGAA
jgi:transcriptional regulator with XRE-family HTH domain